jgi:hypothetical protein
MLLVAAAIDEPAQVHHAKILHDGIAGPRLVMVNGVRNGLIWTHPP